MLRLATLLALLAITSPLVAEPRHITRQKDDSIFNYTADFKPNQTLVLRGTDLRTDEDFELVVSRHGHVEGFFGGSHVSFDVPLEMRDKAVAELRASNITQVAERANQP